MKKMLFLLLLVLFLLPAMAFAGADTKDEALPGSLREYFSSDSFNGYTIGENASRIFDNTGKEDFYFVAATSEKQNILHVFKLSADRNNWDLVLKTSNAIPQGKGFFQMNAYFVPVNSLTTEITVDSMKITNAASAASYLKGRAWLFEAGGNMTYECLMFRPEGPDEGKVQACSLDYDKEYSFDQVIADPLNPAWYKEVKTGTWTVENCDGTEGFWNSPYLKLLLTFDGSTEAYGLTMEFHEHYQMMDSGTIYEGIYTFSLTDDEGTGSWVECPHTNVPNENGTVG